jgi:light-regulated signal transduction histidine kinase (bacteriophytochrome)
VLRELRRDGFEVEFDAVQTAGDFTRCLRTKSYDIVLADYNLPQWTGMEALELLHQEGLDVPLILVSGALPDVTAVDCIKQGASDYVLKDRLARLPAAVRAALQERKLREERERAQRELAEKVEELARSNRELEQFAYVASHDLQEPLRMVAAYTQLLAERYRGKLDEQADKYIDYAVDGAKRMQALIQDLLTFSRVGRTESDVARADGTAVVEQALLNLGSAIRESGAVVNSDRLPVVMANNSLLIQLFQNLIANAIKFRGSEPPLIHIVAEKNSDQWVFSVADNGIGIAPEFQDHIFTIFKRLHTRREYPGNGIGLAICRKIVEQHGGRIWVTSQQGQGSIFRFTLPATEPEYQPGHSCEN